MNTTKVNPNTQKGQGIIWDYNHYKNAHRNIYQAYARPSYAKVTSCEAIEARARATAGYNGDFSVAGASSMFYSTVYSFTDEQGRTHIIKDTHANTYEVII
jgi:hypothetical protein